MLGSAGAATSAASSAAMPGAGGMGSGVMGTAPGTASQAAAPTYAAEALKGAGTGLMALQKLAPKGIPPVTAPGQSGTGGGAPPAAAAPAPVFAAATPFRSSQRQSGNGLLAEYLNSRGMV